MKVWVDSTHQGNRLGSHGKGVAWQFEDINLCSLVGTNAVLARFVGPARLHGRTNQQKPPPEQKFRRLGAAGLDVDKA